MKNATNNRAECMSSELVAEDEQTNDVSYDDTYHTQDQNASRNIATVGTTGPNKDAADQTNHGKEGCGEALPNETLDECGHCTYLAAIERPLRKRGSNEENRAKDRE